MRHAATHLDAVGNRAAESLQVVVQRKLMEGECFDQHVAGRVRQVNHVEIALQHAILSWCAMDGDIGIVKTDFLAVLHEREVVFVDNRLAAVRQVDMPVILPDHDDIDVVTLMVKGRINTLCRAQGNLIF